ncbi:MAG: ATP-binding protein [Pirellulaceae bacterium]
MSEFNTWQESNLRQLAAEVAQLRQRLEHMATRTTEPSRAESRETPSTATPVAPAKRVKRSIFQWLFGQPATQPTSTVSDLTPLTSTSTDETDNSPTVVESNPPPESHSALDELAVRLRLSPFEKQVLLLCVAMEFDTRIADLCARAQQDPLKNFPTFALALALFDEPSWDVLSPERPLRYWRLIEINQPGSQPLTTSPLRADERIVNYVKGLNHLDDRVSPFLTPLELESGTTEIAPSQQTIVETILRRLDDTADAGRIPVVQLVGPEPISKQLVALQVCAAINCRLHRLPIELLPAAPSDSEILARLWQRECGLMPQALYLDAQELDGATTERFIAISRFVTRSDGLFFLGVREALPRLGRPHLALDVAKPTVAEQQIAWQMALPHEAVQAPSQLAGQFNLNLSTIQQLAQRACMEADGEPETLTEKAWEVCNATQRPQLDALAQRLEPKMIWDDLVLPVAETNLLKQIVAQVRQRNKVYGDWGFARKMNRGFGISALFAGESGTGKTMAAEVLANDLRLNLYRIDLSAVVNKYIGETEKNLRRLFDAAEDGGAILFFDEADALFGKRSEVKDSHDRYANIEVNYLLQRLESYRGLAILATNMKSALDTAFLRRLRFIVNFPYPSVADRQRLWQKAFLQPDAKRNLSAPPLDVLDYDRLARLNLNGGHIHNAALNAAFLAAAAGTNVTMQLVLTAAQAEFQKLDRPINTAEFQWHDRNCTRPNVANANEVRL